MSFRRSISGLKNQHLFYDVDLVLFTEGGSKSFSFQEALHNENFNSKSDDALFWGKIFSLYRKDLGIKIKAIGSKSTINKISDDILNSDLKCVAVAMDCEFDKILNNTKSHPNIIYTYGYSWENDVWSIERIHNVVESLSASKFEIEIIDSCYSKFLKDIKIGVYADGYLFWKNDSFFSRKSPLKHIDCFKAKLPEVKNDEIEKSIIEKKLKRSTLYSFGSRKNINVQINCFSHLLADFCYQLIQHIMNSFFELGSIRKEYINRLAIDDFGKNIEIQIAKYYQNSLSKVATK